MPSACTSIPQYRYGWSIPGTQAISPSGRLPSCDAAEVLIHSRFFPWYSVQLTKPLLLVPPTLDSLKRDRFLGRRSNLVLYIYIASRLAGERDVPTRGSIRRPGLCAQSLRKGRETNARSWREFIRLCPKDLALGLIEPPPPLFFLNRDGR